MGIFRQLNLWLTTPQLEEARTQPTRPTSGTTATSQKLEQRRLHMLVKERERLEAELDALEAEVEELVTFLLSDVSEAESHCLPVGTQELTSFILTSSVFLL